MMRTDGDSWDIVSSVGLTALWVAMFRALETARPDALIRDDCASWFAPAAGEPHFIGVVADPSSLDTAPFFPGFMGVRTKFFDEYFLSAAAAGASRVVLVAAGLDAKAHDLLFERIDENSARGCHLAVDNFAAGADTQRFAAITSKYFGQSVFGDTSVLGDINVSELLFDDKRAEPAQWLAEHGWSVTVVNPFELAVVYGRPVEELPEELASMMNQAIYVTAVK